MKLCHLFTHLQSFPVKLRNSIWLWGYWRRLGVVLAQLHWPLSWWPSQRDAFCLPQACCPINHWASGIADGLCPIHETVTSKCNQYFFYFCMNLATCSTFRSLILRYIYWSPDICKVVRITKLNIDLNLYFTSFAQFYIQILFLMCPWSGFLLFWHGLDYYIHSTFILILCSFFMLYALFMFLLYFTSCLNLHALLQLLNFFLSLGLLWDGIRDRDFLLIPDKLRSFFQHRHTQSSLLNISFSWTLRIKFPRVILVVGSEVRQRRGYYMQGIAKQNGSSIQLWNAIEGD